MDPEEVMTASHSVAKILVSDWLWVFLVAICLLLLRNIIENLVAGYLWRKSFEDDSILYISGRKARLTRTALTTTVFYMYDRNTRMTVPNTQLKELIIEEILEEGPLELKSIRAERIPDQD